jgi:type IX secretion system PorP/SprF family membrane protein
MFNGLAINPAYAGTGEALSITALARWQWTGVEGAPTTQTISAHTPVQGKKIGLGLTVVRDEIAVTKQTSVLAAYAYRLPVGSGYLSMGLQGGFSTLNVKYDDVYTLNPDPTFQQPSSQFVPNAGAGVFYYNSVFYAGVSCPMLIENEVSGVLTQRRHYFLSTGMVFDLSKQVKVKPNILVKTVEGSPISADYNLNFLFHEVIWFGVSYRTSESINFLTELNINKKFRIGYSYDHVIESSLKTIATSSHELMLNYRINLAKKGIINTRYF